MAGGVVTLNLARQIKYLPNLGMILVVCGHFNPKCFLGRWTENNKKTVSVRRPLDRHAEIHLIPKDKSVSGTKYVAQVAERLCAECCTKQTERLKERIKEPRFVRGR